MARFGQGAGTLEQRGDLVAWLGNNNGPSGICFVHFPKILLLHNNQINSSHGFLYLLAMLRRDEGDYVPAGVQKEDGEWRKDARYECHFQLTGLFVVLFVFFALAEREIFEMQILDKL